MTTQALQDHILFQTGYLVNGIWKTLDTTFDVLNPATGEVIAKVAKAGKAQTEDAIAAATQAFPAWRAKTAKERSAILYRWYELIIENKSWLGRLMTTEQGKPLKEAEGEVEYAASFIQWFAEEAKRANGEIIPPIKPGSRILATREPIGVVAAITPWNFPMAMLTRKLGPALAAGCTGVIKPANNTPLSAFALLTLAKQAGVPDGVLNAVAGNTHEISDAIMASRDVRKISFTGSTSVGKTLVRNAAETMKKVSMELGGNAPYIVFEDADIDAAVKGAIANKFRNAGQVCVSPTRFLVQERIADEFTDRFTAGAKAIRVGDGLKADVDMGPLANDRRIPALESLIGDAVANGARLTTGGRRIGNEGWFFEPTVLADVPVKARIMNEEPFGPVAVINRFGTLDEAIAEANRLPFGLAAFAFTRNSATATRFGNEIEAGMTTINHLGLALPEVPFGGIKDSGHGTEGGSEALDAYFDTRLVTRKG